MAAVTLAMHDAVAQLSNVRIIQWAAGVEEAFEGVTHRLVNALDDKEAQHFAKQLLEKGPAHKRLEETLQHMRAELDQWLEGMSRAEILQALLDTERAAHDFYRGLLDDVRDPELSKLFIALLREEARHVATVEQARKETR